MNKHSGPNDQPPRTQAPPSQKLPVTAETSIPPEGEEKDYTVAEISARWQCDEETVRRKIRAGKLWSKCPAGKHLVPDSALRAYEESTAARPHAKAGKPLQNDTKHIQS